MRVLIVKTSSLGDLVHTLPALTDAGAAIPSLSCDWVVEEGFAELPSWHPVVRTVIPVALRRWRRNWPRALIRGEIALLFRQLRTCTYDRVIDAQGLFKSAVLTGLAQGSSSGLDSQSAREPWVSWSYHQQVFIPPQLHAIERVRRLFAAALGYALPDGLPDYGLRLQIRPADHPYLVFLPATTWPSKHWPVAYWVALTRMAAAHGYWVRIPWYNPEERQQAETILQQAQYGELLPRQGLTALTGWLAGASGVVGVDTGLIHITAAVGTPAVALYGPTSDLLTGVVGTRQRSLTVTTACTPCQRRICTMQTPVVIVQPPALQKAKNLALSPQWGDRAEWLPPVSLPPPCFTTLPPPLVWQTLYNLMRNYPDTPLSPS